MYFVDHTHIYIYIYIMEKGKIVKSVGIELPDGTVR